FCGGEREGVQAVIFQQDTRRPLHRSHAVIPSAARNPGSFCLFKAELCGASWALSQTAILPLTHFLVDKMFHVEHQGSAATEDGRILVIPLG
ncbi:MAG: hypothetical protein ACREQX_17465, partial [Candidatus Binataceae bacterium]